MSSDQTPGSKTPSSEAHICPQSRHTRIPIAPLPGKISQNIEAIVALHTSAERNVPRHQRMVEAATTFLGRPAFLYISLIMVAGWLLLNVLLHQWGLPQFDSAPFDLLQLVLGIIALPMTIAILIKQERQEKLAEQRAQLSLQLNLLTEQKIAKLIALVEELRADIPDVKDRYDPEVEEMQQAADPQVVMNVLENTLAVDLAQLQKKETSPLKKN